MHNNLLRSNPLKRACQSALIVGGAIVSLASIAQSEQPLYRDLSLSFEQRAKDLIQHMTLEEKVPQLINDAPAIPRLGVREYNWWNEGLHGVAALGDATVFPQAIGMAATWDDELIFQIADVISTEFRAKHYENQARFGGSDWFGGLTVWSPNINIFRDPRWGRGQETYGEDPYLTSRLGVAFVKGLQGSDERYLKTVATPKHFAVHNGPEPSRHKDNFNPRPKDLEETYLPAFRATVKTADAQSIMCAYNAVDGIPACANQSLLRETLREKWGFEGVLVSDCGAVYDVYEEKNHAYTKTPEAGIKAVFDAGLDLICGDATEANHIHSAIKLGLLSESRIDVSLVRLFTARMRLGQFDPRAMVFPKITASNYDTAENRNLALEVAKKSLVLLKNESNFLPLNASKTKLFVTGPNADSIDALVGNYNGSPSQPVTVLKGLSERFAIANVSHSPGTQLTTPVQIPVESNLLYVDEKTRERGLFAEYFSSSDFSAGPIRSRVDKNAVMKWENEIKSGAVRWTGFIKAPQQGEYTLRYKANGGHRIWIDDKLILDAWHVDWRPSMASGTINLEKNKRYSLRIEAFQRGEQGDEQLVWSLPENPGAKSAISMATQSDVIVFVGGLTAQLEGEEIPIPVEGFVGGDKTDLLLPKVQRDLLSELYATGKPVVLILMSGSAMAVNDADQYASAIVQAWYPGGQGGEAVASLLAGDYSPSGKLPVTFYRSVKDLPPFKDYSMENRTYKYFKNEVLYPFGYGMSYTRFRYDKVEVSSEGSSELKSLKVSVYITNEGVRDSDEIVQLYSSFKDVSDAPIRTLVGFQRVAVAKGKTKRVSFTVTDQDLKLVDSEGHRVIHPGQFTLWVGSGQPVKRPGLSPMQGLETTFTIH